MTDKELFRRYKKFKFRHLSLLRKIAHCLFIYRVKIIGWKKIKENKYQVECKEGFNLFNPLTYPVLLIVFILSIKDEIIDFIGDIKSSTYIFEVNVENRNEERE